jgi:hypothetical protein
MAIRLWRVSVWENWSSRHAQVARLLRAHGATLPLAHLNPVSAIWLHQRDERAT